jgi:uncharacterized protein (DUF433 family)
METRITSHPGVFGGKPIIRGLRISVEMILDLLSQGMTPEEILAEYPVLEEEDIPACLRYAKALVASEEAEMVMIGDKG